jgi:tetratricopeptide (TPR) repeat protein
VGGYWLGAHWYYARAVWALFRNQSDETIVWCTRGLDASLNAEKRCDLYSLRAMAYMTKQDVGAATNDLNEAILLSSHFSAPAKDVAGLYLFRGVFRMTVECNEAPLSDLDQAATLSPTDYQPFFARAYFKKEILRDSVDALKDLDKALSLAPLANGRAKNGVPQSETAIADILDMRGLLRIALEQYDTAMSDYEASLRHTTKTDALKGKAIIELAQRNYRAARLYCEDALRANNGDTNEVYDVLGRIAVCEGKNGEAREDFTRASPNGFAVAILDFSEGDTEASLSALKEIVSKRQCLSGEGPGTYGMLLFITGRETEAHDYLQREVGAGGFPSIASVMLVISDHDAEETSPTKIQMRTQLNRLPPGIWRGRLVKLALGDCSLDEALANPETENPQIKMQHVGEANYVAAEMALKRGDSKLASHCFEETVNNCRPDTFPYILASKRLKQHVSKAVGAS